MVWAMHDIIIKIKHSSQVISKSYVCNLSMQSRILPRNPLPFCSHTSESINDHIFTNSFLSNTITGSVYVQVVTNHSNRRHNTQLEVVRVYHHDVYYIPQFSSISLSLWSMHNTLHSVFLAKNLSHILMKAFYLFCYLGKIFGMTQYMTEVSKHCCIH